MNKGVINFECHLFSLGTVMNMTIPKIPGSELASHFLICFSPPNKKLNGNNHLNE